MDADPELLLADLGWTRELARRLVDDSSTADDVSQDAWVRALGRSWPGGRPSRAWLGTVVRNLVRERARRGERRARRERAAAKSETLPSSAELAERVELQRMLAGEVLALDEPYRSVVLLVTTRDVSAAEIARRRGVPAATVRSQLHRGLARLRTRLEEREREDGREWLPALVVFAREAPAVSVLGGIAGGIAMKKVVGLGVVLLVAALGTWVAIDGKSLAHSEDGPSHTKATLAQVRDEEEAAPGGATKTAERVDVAEPAPVPPTVAPVRVQLVDAESGEPVPYLRVELSGEELESDATGRLESAKAYEPGPVVLDLVGNTHEGDVLQTRRREAEAVATTVTHEHALDDAFVPVPVTVGPTFPLKVELPAGYEAKDVFAIFTSADPRKAFDKLYADLDERGGTWVRFSPLASLVGGAPELKLHVGTRDGLLHGEARVSATQGVQPALEVVLHPKAAVRGRVVDGRGEPAAREWVFVKSTKEGARTLAALTEGDGSYVRRWMEPGPYTVEVKHEGSLDFREELDLTLGSVRVLDVELESDGVARDGAIRGRVTSSTGTCSAKVLVVLVQPAVAGWNRTTHVAWEEESGVGSFAFEGLADGDYVVSLMAPDLARIEPQAAQVRPSESEVAFTLVENAPDRVATLVFRATDARTKDPVTTFEPFVTVHPGTPERRGHSPKLDDDGRALWEDCPVDVPFEFIVTAKGYRPVWGTREDARADGAELRIDVVLEEGWGTEVFVVDAENAGLAGARVLFDGVEAGVTGEDGKLRVCAPETPRRIRVELDGWRMVEEDPADPDGVAFREWQRFVTVRMAR